jgi:hypothetical protein
MDGVGSGVIDGLGKGERVCDRFGVIVRVGQGERARDGIGVIVGE